MKTSKTNSSKNESRAIGIIGGASGPTNIILNKRKMEEHEKFLVYASEKITPCKKTMCQFEEYLTEKYNAVPYNLLPHRLSSIKINVILNYFDDLIIKPEPLGKKPTEKEIKEYFEKDTSILQAKEYPAEKLGLEIKAYKLLNVKPNTNMKQKNVVFNDVIVEIETKTGYFNVSNGSEEIINDLILYQGVSEKDIKEKSPTFIAFAYAMKFFKKI